MVKKIYWGASMVKEDGIELLISSKNKEIYNGLKSLDLEEIWYTKQNVDEKRWIQIKIVEMAKGRMGGRDWGGYSFGVEKKQSGEDKLYRLWFGIFVV